MASLAYLLSRWCFLLGGKAFGCHVIKKSSKRRKALLAKVKLEEEQETIGTRPSPKSDDGDWEKLENDGSRTVNHGEKADVDWEGIIGFFHPFW